MPRWTPLASSWAKFHRASTHGNALSAELTRVMGEQNQAIAVEPEIKNGQAIVRVTRIPEFREAGLFMGDAVTNYRAALDHLAWDLVKLGSQPRLTAKQAMQVQFPFATSAVEFSQQRARRLPGITDTEWEIIREYQPYRRGDKGRTMRLLRHVSDTDKHRFIAPAVVCATGFVGHIAAVGCTISDYRRFSPKRALHVGTKLVTMTVVPDSPEYDVKINSQIAVQPSLGRGIPLMPAMFEVRAVVLEVLSRFEAML